jgi:hypothetical protein
MSRQQIFGAKMAAGGEQQGKYVPNRTTDGKTDGATGLSSIISLNNLKYEMPKNSACVTQRQHVRNYFDKNTYGGTETAVCFVNSGSSFIDGCNSFFRFNLQVDINNPTSSDVLIGFAFGDVNNRTKEGHLIDGTAANLIRTISMYSRSGTELERIRRLNLLKYYNDAYTCTKSNYLTSRTVQGGQMFKVHTATLESTTSFNIPFCIPMREISGLWRGPDDGTLLPSQLVSGLKVQIELENRNNAFMTYLSVNAGADWVADEVTAVTWVHSIRDAAIVSDNVTLADVVLRQLNESSAKNGLEYYYSTWDTRTADISSTNFHSIESRKAVSRALQAMLILQEPSTALEDVKKDSFASLPLLGLLDQYQSRVGSLWFPNQPVSDTREAFVNALWANDKYKYGGDNQIVSIEEYEGKAVDITSGVADITRPPVGMLGVTFERSNLLDISGIPMNNARTLTQNVHLLTSPSGLHMTQFLKYVRLARCFVNNIILRE